MLHVSAIGCIVQEPSCYAIMTGKPVVYPDGYTIHRPVFATSSAATKPEFTYRSTSGTTEVPAMEQPFFTATISVTKTDPASSPTPCFTITRSDSPAQKVYVNTKSATTAWREAVDDAARDFPDRKTQLLTPCDSKGKLQVNGIRLFALHLREVQEELMALPGGTAAFETAAAALQAVQSQVSPPASQPPASGQTKARGAGDSASRAHSPTPKPTTTAGAAAAAAKKPATSSSASRAASSSAKPAAAPKSRKRTASAEHDVPAGTAVVVDRGEEGHSQPSTSSVVAVTPVKTAKRPRKPKTDSAAPPPSSDAGEAPAAAPPPSKRRRAAPKSTVSADGTESPPTMTGAPTNSHTAAAAAPVCPDCGLAGAPFCAATGKPHPIPPCTVCGLSTAFCPVSGQPHAGAAQRENRQRGEVHLPGAARKPRRRAATTKSGLPQSDAAGQSGDVAEVTLVSTQDGSSPSLIVEGGEAAVAKKPRRKRARAAEAGDGATVAGAAAAEGSGGEAMVVGDGAQPQRARRARKQKTSEDAKAGGDGAAALAATASASATAVAATSENDMAPSDPVKETAYVYPPLRSPLSIRDRHKASLLLQESWMAQYGDGPVLPAAVAAVPLAPVPVRRAVGGGAASAAPAKAPKKGRTAAAAAVKTEGDTNEEGEVAALPAEDAAHADGVHNAEAHAGEVDAEAGANGSPFSSVAQSPTNASAPGALPTTLAHPLEVTQLASSAAGKRLARFMLLYTSERSQFELLRSHAAATAAAAGGTSPPGGAAGARKTGRAKKTQITEDGGNGVVGVKTEGGEEGEEGDALQSTEHAAPEADHPEVPPEEPAEADLGEGGAEAELSEDEADAVEA